MPDPPRDPRPLSTSAKVLIAGIPAANLADLVTTDQAIRRGGSEINPLMRSPEVRYPLKVLATAGSMALARKLYRDGHPKAGALAAVLAIGIPTAAAIHNSRVRR
jgi:hypothetical protein